MWWRCTGVHPAPILTTSEEFASQDRLVLVEAEWFIKIPLTDTFQIIIPTKVRLFTENNLIGETLEYLGTSMYIS
jgi:hypothetical protein